MDNPIKYDIRAGYLGWSNIRGGLEFYRCDGNNNRWEKRDSTHADPEGKNSGRLLQDDLERDRFGEGSPVVVITLGTRDQEQAKRIVEALVNSPESIRLFNPEAAEAAAKGGSDGQ